MICEELTMFWRADTGEDVFEVVADELPYACGVELLRSIERPLLELGRYAGQYLFGLAEMRMQSGERDRRLPGMFGLAPRSRTSTTAGW